MEHTEHQDLYEGESVKVRGKEYVVPGLSFGQVEKHAKALERLSDKRKKDLTPQMMQDVVTVIHAALSRNYPEMTVEAVKDMLDTRNAFYFIKAVMGMTGFQEAQTAEGLAGE